MVTNAEEQLKKGDFAGANRTLYAVLKADPAFWPALYTRARIFAMEGKYERAIQDCNEALRKYRGFVEAAILRAQINVPREVRRSVEGVRLFHRHSPSSRYSRESVEAARVVSGDLSRLIISHGQQAVKDAKAACSIQEWKDGRMRPRSILLLQLMQRR